MLTNIVILVIVFFIMLVISLLSPRFCSYMPERQFFFTVEYDSYCMDNNTIDLSFSP